MSQRSMPGAGRELIRLDGVSKRYGNGPAPAVADVSRAVAAGEAANSGYPASLISVYATWQLVLLALAGLVIAVAGALGPAGWAASTRTAFALRAE